MNANKNVVLTSLMGVSAVLCAPSALAQLEVGGSLLDNCDEIEALKNAGNFTAARDKARLCLDALEQQVVGEIGRHFLPEIGAWTRTSFEQNRVMGFDNISAVYAKDNVSVNVSLTGQAGGSDSSGLSGLFSGIAQQALRQQGGQQVTVAGLPATVTPDGTLMVTLESGAFLSFESPSFNTAEAALQGMGDLVNDFPVADINAAL